MIYYNEVMNTQPTTNKPTSSKLNKASVFGTPYTVAFTAISLLLLVGIGQLCHVALLVPPLAATAAYIFGMPGIPGTQPRSVMLGHLIAGIIGCVVLGVFGTGMWVAAVAAALAMLAMNAFKLFHIPAVATATLIVLVQPAHQIQFITLLIAASIFLSLMGFAFSKVTSKLQYPLYW